MPQSLAIHRRCLSLPAVRPLHSPFRSWSGSCEQYPDGISKRAGGYGVQLPIDRNREYGAVVVVQCLVTAGSAQRLDKAP
jgi:hypothetical protein